LRCREAAGRSREVVAKCLLEQRERQVRDGTWVPWTNDELTFEECATRALARGRADGVRTIENIAQRHRDYVLPLIGQRKLDNVRKEDVRVLIRALVDAGKLFSRSIHHVYDSIAFVYRYALDQEPPLCTENPCRLSTQKKGELPAKRDKDPRWRKGARWQRWQIESLLAAPREKVPLDRLTFYATVLLTGCRVNEAAGLQIRDYDRAAQPLGRLDIVEQG
jgi:integrase